MVSNKSLGFLLLGVATFSGIAYQFSSRDRLSRAVAADAPLVGAAELARAAAQLQVAVSDEELAKIVDETLGNVEAGTQDEVATAERAPEFTSVEEANLPPQFFMKQQALPDNTVYFYHRVASGDNFYGILADAGYSREKTTKFYDAAKGVHDMRRLQAGNLMKIAKDGSSLQYVVDDTTYVHIAVREDDAVAELKKTPFERKLIAYRGTIKGSLFEAFKASNLDATLCLEMARIFEYDIDFRSEIQKGDSFKVLVEEYYIKDALIRRGNIVAAEFYNDGELYTAVEFNDHDQKVYFDKQGKALRKAFLRSPLKFSRISSEFTLRRLHPILGINRPHLGVDYAAPSGTAVRSIGDGKVTFVGWQGGMGKTVMVKHNSTYTSVYGHLSRFPNGLRIGGSVEQGSLVGYVGQTGLATGPHLHFGLKRNGTFVDSLRINLPTAPALYGKVLDRFEAVRDEYFAILDSIPTVAVTQNTYR